MSKDSLGEVGQRSSFFADQSLHQQQLLSLFFLQERLQGLINDPTAVLRLFELFFQTLHLLYLVREALIDESALLLDLLHLPLGLPLLPLQRLHHLPHHHPTPAQLLVLPGQRAQFLLEDGAAHLQPLVVLSLLLLLLLLLLHVALLLVNEVFVVGVGADERHEALVYGVAGDLLTAQRTLLQLQLKVLLQRALGGSFEEAVLADVVAAGEEDDGVVQGRDHQLQTDAADVGLDLMAYLLAQLLRLPLLPTGITDALHQTGRIVTHVVLKVQLPACLLLLLSLVPRPPLLALHQFLQYARHQAPPQLPQHRPPGRPGGAGTGRQAGALSGGAADASKGGELGGEKRRAEAAGGQRPQLRHPGDQNYH